MRLERGSIVLVDLDPARGHEQAGRRPALILSSDDMKPERSGLITVTPLTTSARRWPTRVFVRPPEGGLRAPSWVIGEQVRTISVERVQAVWGQVEAQTLRAVEHVVKLVLELDPVP
jgi:mRNA interferase MazF